MNRIVHIVRYAIIFISILTFQLLLGQPAAPMVEVWPQPQALEVQPGRLLVNGLKAEGKGFMTADLNTLVDSLFPKTSNQRSARLRIRRINNSQPELQQSGAYRLSIHSKGLDLEVYDQRSVFYALQTLGQLAHPADGNVTLPFVRLTDFPDVPFRGTVEGFYGEPWSHQDRIEQIRFYGRYKLNTYIYGPKDDPYHSSPHWRNLYPDRESQQLRELIKEANRNYVDFVWAIHPGKDIKWNQADSNAIISKFESMYQLGVRSFAVFFDDISGDGTNAVKQADLLNFIKRQFVDTKRDVMPLIMCPTEYNKSWADPKPGTYLDILGERLDPEIRVMWTGNSVIADNRLEGLEWVNARIKRPAYVWWNFPVSDYVRNHLLMGPAYGLDKGTAAAMSGFVSNPMDKAEASKVAIFGVANYAWNVADYDPMASWKKATYLLMPEAPEAFLVFNSHNSDLGPNGHGYRRDESIELKPHVESFLLGYRKGAYLTDDGERIQQEFERIVTATDEIVQKSKNERLLEQILPWLQHFRHLGTAGRHSMSLAKAIDAGEQALGWKQYQLAEKAIDSMNFIDQNFNQNPYQPGIRTGSLVLEPLIKEIMENASVYYADSLLLSGNRNAQSSVNKLLSQTEVVSNSLVFMKQPLIIRNQYVAFSPKLEVVSLEEKAFFGFEIHDGLVAAQLEINFGDESFAQWGLLESSADGNEWKTVNIRLNSGSGTVRFTDEFIKHIRVRNKSDQKQNFFLKKFKLTVRER